MATQLYEIAQNNAELLASRNLIGVINQYGSSLELAKEYVRRGQVNFGPSSPRLYAVVNGVGRVVGAAAAQPDILLRKLHLPIPRLLSVRPLEEHYKYANPEVKAWTDIDEETVLVGAYKDLAAMNYQLTYVNKPHETPWTIEPLTAPKHIHVAIKMAGFVRVASRLFDDGGSPLRVPPINTLYTKSSTGWLTSHGRQKELRKGQWVSGFQELRGDVVEYGSRHFAGK